MWMIDTERGRIWLTSWQRMVPLDKASPRSSGRLIFSRASRVWGGTRREYYGTSGFLSVLTSFLDHWTPQIIMRFCMSVSILYCISNKLIRSWYRKCVILSQFSKRAEKRFLHFSPATLVIHRFSGAANGAVFFLTFTAEFQVKQWMWKDLIEYSFFTTYLCNMPLRIQYSGQEPSLSDTYSLKKQL